MLHAHGREYGIPTRRRKQAHGFCEGSWYPRLALVIRCRIVVVRVDGERRMIFGQTLSVSQSYRVVEPGVP